MARFLSREWFAELGPSGTPSREPVTGMSVTGTSPEAVTGAGAVIGIVVTGAPEGEVRYKVVVRDGSCAVLPPGTGAWTPEVTITADYSTMSSIAAGKVSTLDVLMEGKARISGDTGALSAHAQALSGLDLMPASVRARTTF